MDTTSAIQEQSAPVLEPLAVGRSRSLIVASVLLALLGSIVIAVLIGQRSNGDGSADAANGMTTQRVDGGNVTVAATWQGLVAGTAFEIVLDTHSVDLDGIDLMRLAVLRVDGVEVQPVSWDAPKGGHHREGTLAFPAATADGTPLIDADTITVDLVIRDVAGVAERTYQWNP